MSHLSVRMLAAAVLTASLWLVMPTAGARAAGDDDDNAHFVVTVTNITQGQVFTPIVAASHKNSIKLFRLGQPASEPLEVLDHGGDHRELANLADAEIEHRFLDRVHR